MIGTGVHMEVLVFAGCPHAERALDLSVDVAERLGPGVEVERVEVATAERGTELGFLGSPSIRVNGIDVERRTASEGSMCCRTYDGGAGVPQQWLVEVAVLRALEPRGILFLCVANSARSQIAEGIARSLAPDNVQIWSAGSVPTTIRPEAIQVLHEVGIDASDQRSKTVSEIPAGAVDTVITLCAEEVCPVFLGRVRRLHWSLPDPAAVSGDKAQRLHAFRQIRDTLRERLCLLILQNQ